MNCRVEQYKICLLCQKQANLRLKHINSSIPDYPTVESYYHAPHPLTPISHTQEATVAKPFNLRISRILSNKDRIIEDMERDTHELPETRWPYKNSRTKPSNIGKLSSSVTSADRVPSMTTQAAELRVSHTKYVLKSNRVISIPYHIMFYDPRGVQFSQ